MPFATKILSLFPLLFSICRYTPISQPNILNFDVAGVTLKEDSLVYCNKVTCKIKLKELTSKTSGTYSCEVSGDAPEFKLAHDAGDMIIAGEFLSYLVSIFFIS